MRAWQYKDLLGLPVWSGMAERFVADTAAVGWFGRKSKQRFRSGRIVSKQSVLSEWDLALYIHFSGLFV
jgi:hypothetical protein